jgi:hypothetical protein
MDLLAILAWPEAVLGCIVGLLLAGLVHWLAPEPEPIVLEAALVAAGCIAGLVIGWLSERRKEASRDRD